MTSEAIAIAVGAIISVLLEVVPGLKKVWTNWQWKPLVLFVGFVSLPVIAWALACFAGINVIPVPVNCGVQGALQAAGVGFAAFLGNQTAFSLVSRETKNAQARECD